MNALTSPPTTSNRAHSATMFLPFPRPAGRYLCSQPEPQLIMPHIYLHLFFPPMPNISFPAQRRISRHHYSPTKQPSPKPTNPPSTLGTGTGIPPMRRHRCIASEPIACDDISPSRVSPPKPETTACVVCMHAPATPLHTCEFMHNIHTVHTVQT